MSYSVQYFRDALTALIHRTPAVPSEARPSIAGAMHAAAQQRSGRGVPPDRSAAA